MKEIHKLLSSFIYISPGRRYVFLGPFVPFRWICSLEISICMEVYVYMYRLNKYMYRYIYIYILIKLMSEFQKELDVQKVRAVVK